MSTETTAPLDSDKDLMSYDTSFPMIDPGPYNMKCVEAELMENEAGTVKITLENIEAVRDVKGNVLEPGRGKVVDTVNTQVTGKSTPEIINRGVALRLQAFQVDGVATLRQFREHTKALVGNVVFVSLDTQKASVGKDGKRYEARTIVSKWHKKGASV